MQNFGSKWPQIRTTYLCRTQNTYGTQEGRYQVNLQEKINHNQNFSELSETEAINLKKVASFFQDTIHFHPGHLQPKTLIFSIRALVEYFETKVDPYFCVFTGMSTSFGFLK